MTSRSGLSSGASTPSKATLADWAKKEAAARAKAKAVSDGVNEHENAKLSRQSKQALDAGPAYRQDQAKKKVAAYAEQLKHDPRFQLKPETKGSSATGSRAEEARALKAKMAGEVSVYAKKLQDQVAEQNRQSRETQSPDRPLKNKLQDGTASPMDRLTKKVAQGGEIDGRELAQVQKAEAQQAAVRRGKLAKLTPKQQATVAAQQKRNTAVRKQVFGNMEAEHKADVTRGLKLAAQREQDKIDGVGVDENDLRRPLDKQALLDKAKKDWKAEGPGTCFSADYSDGVGGGAKYCEGDNWKSITARGRVGAAASVERETVAKPPLEGVTTGVEAHGGLGVEGYGADLKIHASGEKTGAIEGSAGAEGLLEAKAKGRIDDESQTLGFRAGTGFGPGGTVDRTVTHQNSGEWTTAVTDRESAKKIPDIESVGVKVGGELGYTHVMPKWEGGPLVRGNESEYGDELLDKQGKRHQRVIDSLGNGFKVSHPGEKAPSADRLMVDRAARNRGEDTESPAYKAGGYKQAARNAGLSEDAVEELELQERIAKRLGN